MNQNNPFMGQHDTVRRGKPLLTGKHHAPAVTSRIGNTGTRISITAGLILLILLFNGCALKKHCQNQEQPAAFSANPINIYPEKFKMIQRCVLTAGGRQLSFDAYLSVDAQRGEIKCVAQSIMGGTLFKYISTMNRDNNREKDTKQNTRKVQILHKTPHFKEKWITDCAARDAAIFFLPKIKPNTRGAGITVVGGDVFQEKHTMDDRGRLIHYRITGNGTATKEAYFSYEKSFTHKGNPIPHKITLADHSMPYRLRITLVKFIW